MTVRGPQGEAILWSRQLIIRYGARCACAGVSMRLGAAEVLAVVGESGSGKSTLVRCLSGLQRPASGSVFYRSETETVDLYQLDEARRQRLMRSDFGVAQQNPRDGLRLGISAGGNIAERLLALGRRHYGEIRDEAMAWLERVEIDPNRIDETPAGFSGGMQQRLQIARTLVTRPRLVYLDEPTSGLDVSVQARILDLLRALVDELKLSMVLVTHDLAVARLLSQRIAVMQAGKIVETGLTDQVLDDPRHPYTQLLVASRLQP